MPGNELLELDLHELQSVYRLRLVEDLGNNSELVTIAQISLEPWQQQNHTEQQAQPETDVFDLELLFSVKDYPVKQPIIKLLPQARSLLPLRWSNDENEVLVDPNNYWTVDTSTIPPRPPPSPPASSSGSESQQNSDGNSSSCSTHSLFDLIDQLAVIIQRARVLLKQRQNHQQPAVIVRDFAYPLHHPAHWGDYDLMPDSKMRRVRALYDFEARGDNELAFNVGDEIQIIYHQGKGWSVGLMNGICGLVPDSYVKTIEENEGE